jgi:malonyl CoA-acyl carrier protein transacylase
MLAGFSVLARGRRRRTIGLLCLAYRVLFHDTMATAATISLTNFSSMQARAPSTPVSSTPRGTRGDGLVYLTREGYSRTLAPVTVGDTVGILLSLEDVSTSSLRCCFRVVRSDGTPVCCGFQTLVVLNRSGQIVPGPERFRRFGPALREKTSTPSFCERVVAGTGLKHIFDAEAIRRGQAAAAGARSTPQSFAAQTAMENALVFTFPGAGSFTSATLLSELAAADPTATPLLRRADEITADVLGAPLAPLLDPARARDHGQRHPDLVQPAIYLASVLSARYLMERGARPDVLAGHSLGELAALALGGAMSVETGLVAVAHRARALRPAHDVGGMLVLFCPVRRARALLEGLGPSSLEVAAVNLGDQTVVSGRHADLDRLAALAAHLSLASTRLESNLPFHSRLLADCVTPFAEALHGSPCPPGGGRLLSDRTRVHGLRRRPAPILASHLCGPRVPYEAMADLYELGARRFVECGGGKALAGIVRKALEGRAISSVSTCHPPGKVAAGLLAALAACEVPGDVEAERASEAPDLPAAPDLRDATLALVEAPPPEGAPAALLVTSPPGCGRRRPAGCWDPSSTPRRSWAPAPTPAPDHARPHLRRRSHAACCPRRHARAHPPWPTSATRTSRAWRRGPRSSRCCSASRNTPTRASPPGRCCWPPCASGRGGRACSSIPSPASSEAS